MESVVPELPWGKIVAVAGALVTIHLAVRGASALASLVSHEARYRLSTGHLPGRR